MDILVDVLWRALRVGVPIWIAFVAVGMGVDRALTRFLVRN